MHSWPDGAVYFFVHGPLNFLRASFVYTSALRALKTSATFEGSSLLPFKRTVVKTVDLVSAKNLCFRDFVVPCFARGGGS